MYIEIPINLTTFISYLIAHIKNLIFSIGLVFGITYILDKEFSWLAVAIVYASLSFVYIPIRNYLHKKVEDYLKILNDGVE